jgi:hypothetical protein
MGKIVITDERLVRYRGYYMVVVKLEVAVHEKKSNCYSR